MTPMRFIAIVVGVFVGLSLATAALAETVCLPRVDLVARLRGDFGESLTARFLTSEEKALIEVYTAPGSWSIIVTDASGQSCIVAVGGAWIVQGVPQGEPG